MDDFVTGTEAAKLMGITHQRFFQLKDKPKPFKILGSGRNTTHLFRVSDIKAYDAGRKNKRDKVKTISKT